LSTTSEHYRAEVDAIVTSAVELIESHGIPIPEMLKKFQSLIVDALAWLLGSEDDLIEVENRSLTPALLRSLAHIKTREYIGNDGC
jgi:hypothetical protein